MGRIDDRTMHRHAENGGIVRAAILPPTIKMAMARRAARLLSFPSICPTCARDNEREREKNNELANSFCFHNFKNFEISRQANTKYLESNRYLYYEKIKED